MLKKGFGLSLAVFIRALVGGFLISIPLPAVSEASANKTGSVRVVYHIDDSSRAFSAMRNVQNHLAADPDAKIVVVALSNGVRFLVSGAEDKRGNSYETKIDELSLAGVDFRVCDNTLSGMKLERKEIYSEVKVVPSGVAEIARLQFREGYAYIKP